MKQMFKGKASGATLREETFARTNFREFDPFENFASFYVRVDILEKLFLKIIENNKDNVFKIDSNMINLIGCSIENFFKLLELMQYKPKIVGDNKEEFFIYKPKFVKSKRQEIGKDNAFGKLSELRFR